MFPLSARRAAAANPIKVSLIIFCSLLSALKVFFSF